MGSGTKESKAENEAGGMASYKQQRFLICEQLAPK
jgi:hypothetical protein